MGVQDGSQFLAKIAITHIPIDPWGLQTAQWVKQSGDLGVKSKFPPIGKTRFGEMVSTFSWQYRKRS